MKNIAFIVIVLISTVSLKAQSDYEKVVKRYQDSLSETYENPKTSILSKKQLKSFDGLKFYTINDGFLVSANFKKTPEAVPFGMSLSSGSEREYVMYGIAYFIINTIDFELPIYQNTYYRDHPEEEYGNSLFLPFTDHTSGDGSYGGGRYIDLTLEDIVAGKLIIDFNKAYNPYCAYTVGYSCPISPQENNLKFRIEVGVKDFEGEY